MGRRVADDIRAAGAEDTGVCGRLRHAPAPPLSVARCRTLSTSACHAEVRLAVYRSWGGWPVKRPPFGGYQVPEHAGRIRIVSPRFIRHAHAAGLEVQVWTVDTEADMERLLGWGADALDQQPARPGRDRPRRIRGRRHARPRLAPCPA